MLGCTLDEQLAQRRHPGTHPTARFGHSLGSPTEHATARDRIDRVDHDGRIVGDRLEHPHEPSRPPGHGLVIEQVPRVRQHTVDPGRLTHTEVSLAKGDLEIETCLSAVDFMDTNVESRHRDLGGHEVLVREHHLEQRVVCTRGSRCHACDDLVERRLRMSERVEVVAADPAEQIDEGTSLIDGGAQHDRADQHSHQVVQAGSAASRHRGSDADVVAPRESGEQHHERCVHHHEGGGVVLQRHLLQRGMQFRRNREGHRSGGGRTVLAASRSIGRQFEDLRRRLETLGPVRKILVRPASRLRRIAEQLPLPPRVVGVAHPDRAPARFGAAPSSLERLRQIAVQRHHRQPVQHRVVRDDGQSVGRVPRAVQGQAHRRGRGDVDRTGCQLLQPVRAAVRRLDDLGYRCCGLDHLDRTSVDLPEDGAERLVAFEHVRHRGPQDAGVEFSLDLECERDVVRGGRVPARQHPHPLLRRRQWGRLVTVTRLPRNR